MRWQDLMSWQWLWQGTRAHNLLELRNKEKGTPKTPKGEHKHLMTTAEVWSTTVSWIVVELPKLYRQTCELQVTWPNLTVFGVFWFLWNSPYLSDKSEDDLNIKHQTSNITHNLNWELQKKNKGIIQLYNIKIQHKTHITSHKTHKAHVSLKVSNQFHHIALYLLTDLEKQSKRIVNSKALRWPKCY